jgi:uncharacterized protein YndB with AHSA1/START domain
MTNVEAQIAAVSRSVGSVTEGDSEMRVQSLRQTYPSAIDDVWEATTTPDRIRRWFLPVEGDLHLGGRYQLVGNAGGTIEECRPPRDGAAAYRVTWEYGGGVSWVEVSLTSTGADRTDFELRHIARASDLPEGFWELYGPGATGVGWDQGLLGLALHLGGDGAGIAPEQAEEWMLSEGGKRFARAAADAWAQAQVADGGDPEAAAAAADATYLFYTGASAEQIE